MRHGEATLQRSTEALYPPGRATVSCLVWMDGFPSASVGFPLGLFSMAGSGGGGGGIQRARQAASQCEDNVLESRPVPSRKCSDLFVADPNKADGGFFVAKLRSLSAYIRLQNFRNG